MESQSNYPHYTMQTRITPDMTYLLVCPVCGEIRVIATEGLLYNPEAMKETKMRCEKCGISAVYYREFRCTGTCKPDPDYYKKKFNIFNLFRRK